MVLKRNTKQDKDKKQDSPTEESQEPKDQNTSENDAPEQIDETEKLTQELAAEKDKSLRLSAEFENFKKRKERELADFRKFANESVFKQFLTVIDNMERAIDAAEQNGDQANLLEGIQLTHKEMLKTFSSFNVTVIDANNQPFDPNFHQAVTQEATNEFPENTVTSVLQKGYLLHDRLIRPAMVVVSKKAENETENSEEK